MHEANLAVSDVNVDMVPLTVVPNDTMQRRRWQVHVQKVVDSLTNGMVVEDVGNGSDDDANGTLRPASPSFIRTTASRNLDGGNMDADV
jgi:hypothetical protein